MRSKVELTIQVDDTGRSWIAAEDWSRILRDLADGLNYTPSEAMERWSAAQMVLALQGFLRQQADAFDLAVIDALGPSDG